MNFRQERWTFCWTWSISGHVSLTSQRWRAWRRRVRWWCRQATMLNCLVLCVTGAPARRPVRASLSQSQPSVSAYSLSVECYSLASTLWPRAMSGRCAVSPMSPTPVRNDLVTSVRVIRRSHVTRGQRVHVFYRRFLVWESTSSTTSARRYTRHFCTRTASRQPGSIERSVTGV